MKSFALVALAAVALVLAVGCEPQATKMETASQSERYIYVVREGDIGFQTVSEQVYGDSKHWQIIAKANPDVDEKELKPGMELTIPALPGEGSARRQPRGCERRTVY